MLRIRTVLQLELVSEHLVNRFVRLFDEVHQTAAPTRAERQQVAQHHMDRSRNGNV